MPNINAYFNQQEEARPARGAATINHNQPPNLGDAVHAAMVASANRKVEALTKRRWADRAYDLALLRAEGSSAEDRKAAARMDPAYAERDAEAHAAECIAIVAKAEADGAQIKFEYWRTEHATRRAEMNLR